MIIKDLLNIDDIGVYAIKHIKSEKLYIGSTTQAFKARFKQHVYELNNGKHKNSYLSFAWQKYGENAFEFAILEVVNKDMIFEREQYYMDLYSSYKKRFGYNINSKATGGHQFSAEIIKKRTENRAKTNIIAKEYANKIKANKLTIEDVPNYYKNFVKWKLRFRSPMLGKSKATGYNFDHLKVPKTKTEALLNARTIRSINMRKNTTPSILVYNALGTFISEFRSISDLHEFSLTKDANFPCIYRNESGRNGYKKDQLSRANIGNVCNGKATHYKGLIFRFKDSELPVTPLTYLDFSPSNKNRIVKEIGRLSK